MLSNKINNKGQAVIFKNHFLESLTKTRPWVIYAFYIPVCAYLLYYSSSSLKFSLSLICWVYILGVFIWTLFEYVAHRYLFHYQPTSEIGKQIVYIFHGNHHEFPRDKMRLFMPPLPSVIFAFILFGGISGLSYLLFGSVNYACIFFPGFISGYLIYVSMHYAIHSFSPPKGLKALWRNHHLHHYKYPEKGFGVSSLFWDTIFGAQPDTEDLKNDK